MAQIIPIFEKAFIASGTTSTKDDWYDLSSYGPDANSPIPSGKQLWLGFATFISNDKNLTFELRPNLAAESLGTVAKTQLRTFASVPNGESRDVDMYQGGAIATLAPVTAVSTGVEKLWLRVRSGTNTVATFDVLLFYTLS